MKKHKRTTGLLNYKPSAAVAVLLLGLLAYSVQAYAAMGVIIDKSKFPVGFEGRSDIVTLSGSNRYDAGSDVGAFRLWCKYSHMSYDDPIVAPGQDNAAHLHMFWGNRSIDENSTTSSIVAADVESTCDGGGANKSAYWAPALIFDGKTPLEPDDLNTYYKSGYRAVPESQIGEIPDNLVMIAGNAKSKTRQSPDIAEWHCNDNYTSTGLIPQNCGPGDTLGLDIYFPQCWDGTNLDSADHKSHMRYPGVTYWGDIPNPPGTQGDYGDGCTKEIGYNNPIPVIKMNIEWTLPSGVTSNKLRLSSDAADAQPGASAHADFMEGWDRGIQKAFINNCIKKHQSSTFDLCDGRVLNYNLPRVRGASTAVSSPGSGGSSSGSGGGSSSGSPSASTGSSEQPVVAQVGEPVGTTEDKPIPVEKQREDTDGETQAEREALFGTAISGFQGSEGESGFNLTYLAAVVGAWIAAGLFIARRHAALKYLRARIRHLRH